MAKPLRLALGACIIQAEYGYSDEEITLQIQENPYLQYFCGYAAHVIAMSVLVLNLRKIQLALSALWPFLLEFFLSTEKFVFVQ